MDRTQGGRTGSIVLLVVPGADVADLAANVAERMSGRIVFDEAGAIGQRLTEDQNALIQLAKQAKRTGGVTEAEAEILQEWADELGISRRGPEVHPNRGWGAQPHVHVGNVGHIPVVP